jgi:hypothetical protein
VAQASAPARHQAGNVFERRSYSPVINVPTVLVIGAGASKPYGLPLGGDLLTSAKLTCPL